MTPYREILRLYSQGISQRSIAASCSCSRNTVARTIEEAERHSLSVPLPKELTDEILGKLFYPKEAQPDPSRRMPDYEHIHRELAKNGVTLSLLWTEYCESCRAASDVPFKYTQFCFYYSEFVKRTKGTMHIERKPGEIMEVDWAGDTAKVADGTTGKDYDAYIFVAVLPYSHYAYVEAFLTQNEEAWITAHVNAYKYFGGVTKILVCDNLKTGVDRVAKGEVTINRIYQELSEHHGTAVLPARVRKPRDKGSVESTVGNTSTWIIAALRNQVFFSLSELNTAISVKLEEFNNKPFQKKQGSRRDEFYENEKHYLLSLPRTPYELASWKTATVMFNCHIAVDKQNYSVPYEYIKQKVDVRITERTIEVFDGSNRICSHPRLHGRPNQYSTVSEHLPENQKQYMEWTPERFVEWAKRVGNSTEIVVSNMLSDRQIPQQAYKACMALLKLGDKYSTQRLEAACCKALSYTSNPSFKNIQTILANGQDKLPEEDAPNPVQYEKYSFTRGADYYDRRSK